MKYLYIIRLYSHQSSKSSNCSELHQKIYGSLAAGTCYEKKVITDNTTDMKYELTITSASCKEQCKSRSLVLFPSLD